MDGLRFSASYGSYAVPENAISLLWRDGDILRNHAGLGPGEMIQQKPIRFIYEKYREIYPLGNVDRTLFTIEKSPLFFYGKSHELPAGPSQKMAMLQSCV